MMIIPQLVKREARPHFSATYCSLLLRIHLRRYHMTLCWFAPKHQKDFSHLFHILFFLSSPQLGSHEFPSADYFLLLSLILTVLHSLFAHKKHLPSHTLPGAFPGPILSHSAAFVTATFWVLEIMLTFSSMLCVIWAALTPLFPSQRERKATTQHTNFYWIQTHGQAGIDTFSYQHRANCHFFTSNFSWSAHLWSHCTGVCR